jgi:isopenicillin N synthase-like dioxygenase
MTQPTIPIVNYSDLVGVGGGARDRAIAHLGTALQNVGFFILDRSPVSSALLQQAYQVATQFFELPEPIKAQYQASGKGGFTAFAQEQAKGYTVPDLKEFWHVNAYSLSYTDAPWPQEIPDFQPIMRRLYAELEACARVLLQACALYLGQPADWLVDMATGGNTVLRLAHYPPLLETISPGSLRAAPHEDINLITLLCSATVPGLEILSQAGEWVPVQVNPDQIVVDTGDMLQNLTNGLIQSTTHQVVNPHQADLSRLSIPFFVHPRPEVDLSPQPQFLHRTGGYRRYPEITAGQYLQQRLQEIKVKTDEGGTDG